ncbi:hypothetical protein DWF00_17565 [Bosea caraganae]|uniref:Co-chaperone DjlA N-terminal domain-containing protein n=1 Tax=Bosea caraganae TaxID=2763117 RepID=A0A370L7V4_9HYPH|nr:hypothetical protein [Bosea caraganae]RDJ25015.1 hypothetical protein DWF00_17565 [Bosea caraganae]RDJ26125.1 hypothetical protein DWE98_09785 [Bosea caraganae]
MPVLVAIVGAVMSGIMYWFIYGKGMETVDHWLNDQRNAKRRLAARDQLERAPLKAMTESREGAVALMLLVAKDRGEPTVEQIEAIKAEMRGVLEFGRDLEARLVVARHAVDAVPLAQTAVDDLKDLLRKNLSKAELNELFIMLRKIAALHGGPTDGQDRIIAYAERLLRQPQG